MAFADSINSLALEHEGAMVDVYSKMKPDTFRLQLQTVLTAYYEDIKGMVRASSCTKSKVVKSKFEDQDDTCPIITGLAQDTADADAANAAHAPAPAPRYPARRERGGSRTQRGGASSGPQPWG